MALGCVCAQAAQPIDARRAPAKAGTDAPLVVAPIGNESALISWTGECDSYNLRYREAAGREVIFFDNFDGELANWAIVDNDGDGNNWSLMTPSSFGNANITAHSGDYVLMSRSWVSAGALTPDNWLITPQVTLKGTLSFWILDDSEYHETFDVLVSTTDNNLESFTSISGYKQTVYPWTEFTFDLSAYEGQQGYIAIRHYNCTDQDFFFVDDFGIYGEYLEGSEWTVIENAASPYLLTGLNPNTNYEVEIQPVNNGVAGDWSEPVQFTTVDEAPIPSDLEATNIEATQATLNWVGVSEEYTLRYRTAAIDFEGGINEDFEGEEMPEGWTTIDNDGDGNNWGIVNGLATSESYRNNVGALTPDNWLVSPQINLGGMLSVEIWGQDADWSGEHFAVYLSTTGNTVDDFTTELIPETVATGTVTEYTADLTSYEGQQGYIAIRHFNITDMFRLNVDNFRLIGTPAGEWNYMYGVTYPFTLTGLAANTTYEAQVANYTVEPEASMLNAEDDAEFSKSLFFTTTEATGIENVTKMTDGVVRYYDISGRYVGTSLDNAPAGLYIGTNGKKIVK